MTRTHADGASMTAFCGSIIGVLPMELKRELPF